jgi:hypothetical protein
VKLILKDILAQDGKKCKKKMRCGANILTPDLV